MTVVFFGYPGKPAHHSETIRTTATRLAMTGRFTSVVWEEMVTEGRIIIEEVLLAIDSADYCVFDVTHRNDNVLYEAGYAMMRGRPTFLTLDTTVTQARLDWGDFALLKPIGYTSYQNSTNLSDALTQLFNTNPPAPYDSHIEPVLSEFSSSKSLLYCTTFDPFEAANRLDQLVDERRRRGLDVFVSNPSESSLDPLSWYVRKINSAAGVLVHMAGPQRNRSKTYNARHALVAGMSRGFDIPTLLLAEESYSPPFDFESAVSSYRTAEECIRVARQWFGSLDKGQEKRRWGTTTQELGGPLSGFSFGEHVAENEMSQLGEYFLPTSAYQAALTKDAIYVGHRGTGKTASALQAFDEASSIRGNLAVLIKPAGFEFPAVLAILRRLPDYQHDYFFDSLWRFVLLTEIAAHALSEIENRKNISPLAQLEAEFVAYIDHAPFNVRSEVSVRLEQVLTHLNRSIDRGPQHGDSRNRVNEGLHADALGVLRRKLGDLLTDRDRVAIFVDNLDKGWERGADFETLARLILGLLTARGSITNDFRKQDHRRKPANVTVAIFLRSDIFNYVRTAAREPDKLPVSEIVWDDSETLTRLIEARYVAIGPSGLSASNLWTRLFVSSVNDTPAQEFVLSRVLPRPRDIIYFCNAAVARALDRGHYRVEEGDLLAANEQYSQYAYGALLVENGVTIPELEAALLSFLGSESIREFDDLLAELRTVKELEGREGAILEKLISMSFLGIETAEGQFTFPEVGIPYQKAIAKAKRLSGRTYPRRVRVHPAFHSFLEIVDG